MTGPLLVNLAFLRSQPTGLSTYALGILPHLTSTHPLLLRSPTSDPALNLYPQHPIPSNLTSEQGRWGHARRLWWTERQLPALYRELGAALLFSPIPEAPLLGASRFVVTMHDLIPLRFPRPRSPATLYQRYYVPRVLHRACHVICNSQTTATDVHDWLGVPTKQLTAIPLAYDAQHYRWLDLPTLPYFLYTGRHDRHKNLIRLVEAFAHVPPPYELWLAGPPSRLTPQIQAAVAAYGVEARVRFLGYVPLTDLPTVINQATALVLPSLWEGFGLPVLEAMACGTPVITSDRASMAEIAGEAALLVDPLDAGAIAQAMRQLTQDSAACQHLRRAGLARAQDFSWAKTGAATAAVLAQYL